MANTKRCPYCREIIKADAIKCRFCGSMLDILQPSGDIPDYDTLIRLALISKYEILHEVGRGGMAIVYKAIQKNLSREVALKVILPNLVNDQELVIRFHREAKTAASLNHPNIVKIFDDGAEKGIHYMAMEFLEGEDIFHRIRRNNRLTIEETTKYISQIAGALQHVHAKGLVHRDVKPSNIFITNDDRAVLTDFGIVHVGTGPQLTQIGTVFGTPEYMSPEQAQGKEINHKSDLYSLGIVIYECLTGSPPLKSDNPLVTINMVINNRPAPINTVLPAAPKWICDLLVSLLEKDPGKRFPDQGMIIAKNLQEGVSRKTFAPSTPKQVKKEKQRKQKAKVNVKHPQAPRPKNPSYLQKKLLWLIGSLIILILGLVSILIIINQHSAAEKAAEIRNDSDKRPASSSDQPPKFLISDNKVQPGVQIPSTGNKTETTKVSANPTNPAMDNNADIISSSVPKKGKVFTSKEVEKEPLFPLGHNDDFVELIQSSIKFPPEAKSRQIHGVVKISFIIDELGKVDSDLQIEQGLGGGCTEEARRVVKEILSKYNTWTPGYYKGQPVRTKYVVSVDFK